MDGINDLIKFRCTKDFVLVNDVCFASKTTLFITKEAIKISGFLSYQIYSEDGKFLNRIKPEAFIELIENRYIVDHKQLISTKTNHLYR